MPAPAVHVRTALDPLACPTPIPVRRAVGRKRQTGPRAAGATTPNARDRGGGANAAALTRPSVDATSRPRGRSLPPVLCRPNRRWSCWAPTSRRPRTLSSRSSAPRHSGLGSPRSARHPSRRACLRCPRVRPAFGGAGRVSGLISANGAREIIGGGGRGDAPQGRYSAGPHAVLQWSFESGFWTSYRQPHTSKGMIGPFTTI